MAQPIRLRESLLRKTLRGATHALCSTLADFDIHGRENVPESGPLIVVGNHFSFIDPVAFIHSTRWSMDFIAGTVNPGAPRIFAWIPAVWGVHRVARGSVSTQALKISEKVLSEGGILGIFPEGGTWARVLRPPRPGAAYLSARTGSRILPIGMDGLNDVFPALGRGRRARVTIKIGKPFGPFSVTGRGRERRKQLDEIGGEIMRHIAPLIPPEKRGVYSDDPALREQAQEAAIYPWENLTEHEFTTGQQVRERRKSRRGTKNT